MAFDTLIIDGHNLAHQEPFYNPEVLIQKLDNLSSQLAAEIILVFDGNPFPIASRSKNIKIIFSGKLKSADDIIERLLLQERGNTTSRVVSSDRQIIDVARGQNWSTSSSLNFLSEIKQSQQQLTKSIKRQNFMRKPTLGDHFPDEAP